MMKSLALHGSHSTSLAGYVIYYRYELQNICIIIDAAEYVSLTRFKQETKEEGRGVEMGDAKILDELTTSRGELKVRTVSFSEDRSSQVIVISLIC